jgi:transposase
MVLPTAPVDPVSALGLDDFSFRRGRTFGTILVDLDRHRLLDLLPDRTSATAAAWMETHPEIDLVSRDRGGEYAAAARLGAPQAIQCADRFHLYVRRIGACSIPFTERRGWEQGPLGRWLTWRET